MILPNKIIHIIHINHTAPLFITPNNTARFYTSGVHTIVTTTGHIVVLIKTLKTSTSSIMIGLSMFDKLFSHMGDDDYDIIY